MKSSQQNQIATAIQYIRSQFPKSYNDFKEKHHGQKYFQKQLQIINATIQDYKYASLKTKIIDQLLVKLRFIALNQSYLQKFQSYLIEKFINIFINAYKASLNLQEIYTTQLNIQTSSRQQSSPAKNTNYIMQRYSILLQSIISILKYCFGRHKEVNSNKEINQCSLKFQNEMLKSYHSKDYGLGSKSFVKFLLSVLSQKLDEIIKYKIIDIRNIYPQLFSVLSDGFLNFKGGMKCLEIIQSLLIKIIDQNKVNIWKSKVQNSSINNYLSRLSSVKIDWNKLQTQEKQSENVDLKQVVEESFEKRSDKLSLFQNQCKKRLLLCLQTLLVRYGYSVQHKLTNTPNQHISLIPYIIGNSLQLQTQQNSIRRIKHKKFINEILITIQTNNLQIIVDDQGKTQIKIVNMDLYSPQSKDIKILTSLIILFVQLESENIAQVTSTEQKQKSSNLIKHLQYQTNHNQFSQLYLFDSLRNRLKEIFIDKFKLLMNRNKIISTQKTRLLRQLKNLAKYIDSQKLQIKQIQYICLGLKKLFQPNQHDLNKPLIVIRSQQMNQNTINRQCIPLVDLKASDSFSTYPITLSALKQSMKFQQKKYLLNDIKLFNWFQSEQINIKYFNQLIQNADLNMKLSLCEYFLSQLLNNKMQQTDQVYGLEMSLTKFYELIVNMFYIEMILNRQNGILSFNSIKQLRRNNTKYDKLTIMLKTLYQILQQNKDIKRLLVSNKEEQLLVYWNLKITYAINIQLLNISTLNKDSFIIKNHSKLVIFENLILQISHQTYLLKLLTTFLILQHSAPHSIAQALSPLQSTLIHRNGGNSLNNKRCNLQFMRNLIKICNLKHKQAQQLAEIYLSKSFISKKQANQVISLIFPKLSPQTMRKCILSIKNWYLIFMKKQNVQLLNNQPMKIQQKQELFHSNDGQNVTISNALGVIVLELGDKWIAQLSFQNGKKQTLIDCMLNLVQVNDKLIFWKRYFIENVLQKVTDILDQILCFNGINNTSLSSSKSPIKVSFDRSPTMYDKLKNKILKLLLKIPDQYLQLSASLGQKVLQNLKRLKSLVQKQYNYLKIQCFVNQKYQKYLQSYKVSNSILQKIDRALAKQKKSQSG